MNINDVIEDGNRYYKLDPNKTVKVVFANKFGKKVGEYNGKTTVKYEVECTIQDGTEVLQKVWSGSSKFYQDAMSKSEANSVAFDQAIFKITRTGEGIDTRYNTEFEGIISAGA